ETMRNMLSLGNTFLRILRAIDNVKIITEAVSVFGHTLKILMSGELDFYLYKSVEDVYQNSYSENPFSPKEAIESLKDNLVVLLGS
ncbi:MAG: hypothetical protein NZ585_14945, partial [Chloracidobacterium sp.]|nr:hypothetical protein [Chloracidobacterium sp.]